MARAPAQPGAAVRGGAPRKPAVPKRVVVGLIVVYCAGLAGGLLAYRGIDTGPVAYRPETPVIPRKQQMGRIFILTPNGCQAGSFDNTKAGLLLAPTPCDEAAEKIAPESASPSSGDSRIRAIGRYFRGAD